MNKQLPIYELTISEENDAIVSAIALVENPAIQKDFMAFAEEKELKFQYDNERKELFGPAMIPNQKIYRRDENGNEFEVFFSADTIRKVSQVFFKKGFQANLNIEHDNAVSAGSFTYQSVIVDRAKGIQFGDYPDGTWLVGAKVTDDNVWKAIKEGKHKGFSVEGIFQLNKMDFTISNNKEDTDMNTVIENIKSLNEMFASINY